MSKSRPLYAKLASELIQQIKSGEFPLGGFLPTEIELVEQHRVSRATARAALNQLVHLGLVSRRKGIGTKIIAITPSLGYSPSATTIEDLINYDAATIRKVVKIERVVADDKLSERLDGKLGRRWTRVFCLRYDMLESEMPICLNDNYVNEEFESVAQAIPKYPGLIAHKISDDYGVSVDEIQQTIRAIGISREMAKMLNCTPGDYALEITRRYYDINSTILLIAISVHPSSRFTYTSSIKRPR